MVSTYGALRLAALVPAGGMRPTQAILLCNASIPEFDVVQSYLHILTLICVCVPLISTSFHKSLQEALSLQVKLSAYIQSVQIGIKGKSLMGFAPLDCLGDAKLPSMIRSSISC
jgi:hypothetical protein